MLLRTLIWLNLILISFVAKTQENNNWVFGAKGDGLNFSNDTPNLFVSKAVATCGPACISDERGELLLYFDGFKVFNKYHEVVENADNLTGDPLGGYPINISLFLKSLTDPSKYYLIFVAGELNQAFLGGIYIYTIDVDANGGKGKLNKSYNLLFPGSSVLSLAATWHANRRDIWLVCRMGKTNGKFGGSDTLVSLLYDGTTFFHKKTHVLPFRENMVAGTSYRNLVFSGNGKWLAETYSDIRFYPNWAGSDSAKTYVALLGFDNTTGEILGRRYLHYYADCINSINNVSLSKHEFSYNHECAFSPNDSIVYTICEDSNSSTFLTQFPIYATDPVKECFRYNFDHGTAFSIATAPDDRVYIGYGDWDYATRPRIAVLDNPNKGLKYSSPNLTAFMLKYPDRYYTLWFPNQLKSRLKKPKFSYSQSDCNTTGFLLNESDTTYRIFTWYFEDIPPVTTNKKENIPVSFTKSKKYYVKLKAITVGGWVAWYDDTINYLAPPKATFTYDTSIGCRFVAFTFKNECIADTLAIGGYLHWYFGDGTDTLISLFSLNQVKESVSHSYTKTGIYTIRLIFNNGFCSDTIEKVNAVVIKDAPKPGINPSQVVGCQPLTVTFNRKYTDTIVNVDYTFGDGTQSISTPIVNNTNAPITKIYTSKGIFYARQYLTGPTGCITSDSILLHVWSGFDSTEKPYLKYATVDTDTVITVEWLQTPNAKKYSLYKSTDKLNWKLLGDFTSTQLPTYTDKSVTVHGQRYWYKVQAFDTCLAMRESNLASSLLLSGEQKDNEYCVIRWQPYETWPTGINQYDIEVRNSSGVWEKVNQTSAIEFTDFDFANKDATQKCYRITAIEARGFSARSTSNTVCLPFKPVIWIPNSFTPDNDQLNDTLTISSLGIVDMEILIFNQYGELIFNQIGADCRWDGNFKSRPVPDGVYAIIIHAKTNTGQKINYHGNITVLR